MRALRLFLAVVGGYVFTAGFIGFFGAGLPHLGLPRSESVILSAVLGAHSLSRRHHMGHCMCKTLAHCNLHPLRRRSDDWLRTSDGCGVSL